ncbi:hypothetical protein BCR43DRAFT_511901 [Syncephalastrum racemosum]|uniref:AMP-dependent synthetase/ligase domain-containing protein n=1 Tax=Syncephalastrum racemosum TaxID=13706 RepID=A0A1X2HNV3_SYNRA|nr:hypothetical protein BCR43DRAFT_511901 [Syncephalastrum racemosum]
MTVRPHPNTPLPDASIYEVLFENNVNKNAVVLVDAENTDRFYTVASLQESVLKFGGFLQQKYDWKAGDVLAICAGNDIDYVLCLHGSVTIGGLSATVDHHTSAEDIAESLRLVQAKLVVTDDEYKTVVAEAVQLAALPHSVITFKDIQTLLSGDALIPLAAPARYEPDQLAAVPAYLYFTSGTTGTKKAVCISQRNAVAIAYFMDTFIPCGTRALTYTAIHHIGQLALTTHHGILRNIAHYIMDVKSEHTKALDVCEAIQKHKIDTIVLVPWVANTIAKDVCNAYDLSSLREAQCGGSTVDASIIKRVYERRGIKLGNAYALTEVMGLLVPSWESAMKGSPGRAGPRTTLKLVDVSDKEVAPGGTGELCVKSPTVFMGYYNDPEATKAVFDEDGFFHTGDLFCMNEDGEYVFNDRKKNLIKYFNHHLYPADIESVLIRHPYVSECCVLGIYSPEEATEFVTAFVSLSKEHIPVNHDVKEALRHIREYVDSRVLDARRLRGGVVVMESFPRTAFGKILRPKIQEMYKNGLIVQV